MRIHSSKLSHEDLADARRIARVWDADGHIHGSRKRDRAWNILLRGESRRRPNSRDYGSDEHAATWDQWGVFLAVLFARDPELVTPYYADAADFHHRTSYRFLDNTSGTGPATADDYWPDDTHGDHTFRYNGVPYSQSCTKCSARQVWGPR